MFVSTVEDCYKTDQVQCFGKPTLKNLSRRVMARGTVGTRRGTFFVTGVGLKTDVSERHHQQNVTKILLL